MDGWFLTLKQNNHSGYEALLYYFPENFFGHEQTLKR